MAAESSRYYGMEKISRTQRAAKPLSLQMLQDITKNFSEERVLGRGGFGVVYKGVLHNGEAIAIKKFLPLPRVNNEEQFKKEVAHLMGLEHKNIVGLVGYCNNIQRILVDIEGTLRFADEQEMFLCLEFLPGGSLDKHISDACHGLDWQMRCKIIMGVCHGLHYLHENHIIHLDLKPANILLDDDMMPKITDFGLSTVIGPEQTRIHTSTCVGTRGYMAPEYLEKCIISKKSDVFSVGVVIIEIIVGHKNYPDGTEMSMQKFVEHELQNWRNRLEKLTCASLEKDCQQIKVCIEIGLRCVHTDAAKRPTTREIIECLITMAAESSRSYDMENISRAQTAAQPLPLQMLQDITQNFSEERVLGRGGFGVVYKGVLHDGEAIAIKKFQLLPRRNNREQLTKGVARLMGLKHKNIVRLVGYCNNKIRGILVDIEGTLHFRHLDVIQRFPFSLGKNGEVHPNPPMKK